MPLNILVTTDAAQSMQTRIHERPALNRLAVALIGMDLFFHLRKPHELMTKECTRWLIFCVNLAVVFGIHTLFHHSPKFAFEYFVAYFTGCSFSTDNTFIFIIIIGSFRVLGRHQQEVLLWGIVTALILRFVFTLLGATLLESFSRPFSTFAAFPLQTVWNQFHEGVEDRKDPDHDGDVYKPNTTVHGARRVFMITNGFVGDKMLVWRNHKTLITPFFLCTISIGSAGLMFAFDPIPVFFGLTAQPFIIFAANAFTLMRPRQFFFLVKELPERLVYLHYGFATIPVFIGFKLLTETYHGQGWLEIVSDTYSLVSLAAILVVFVPTVVTSLGKTKHEAIEGVNVEKVGDEIEAGRAAQAFREKDAEPSGARKPTGGRRLEELQRSGEERWPGDEQRPEDGGLSGRKGFSNKQPRNRGRTTQGSRESEPVSGRAGIGESTSPAPRLGLAA